MDSVTKFTIRPRPESGESLTGYLYRVAEENHADFSAIYKSINAGKKINMSLAYLMDIRPTRLQMLCKMLNLSEESVEQLTFSTAIYKFMNDNFLYADETYNKMISSILDKKFLRFCPSCLRENGIHNLIWQVSALEMCLKHTTYLQSQCLQCATYQPYVRTGTNRHQCIKCDQNLSYQQDTKVSDQQFISAQKRLYDTWSFLLCPHDSIVSPINGLSKEQTTALLMLYLAQNQESSYKLKAIKHINRGYAKGLRRAIRGDKGAVKPSIPIFVNLVQQANLTIKQVKESNIPPSYLQSILSDRDETKIGPCLTPWCPYQGTGKSMVKIPGHHSESGTKHYLGSVCTNCYIRYGYNRENHQWEEIGDKISTISMTIIPMLEAGTSRKRMNKLLQGISLKKINELSGYIAYHRLLPKELCARFIPESFPHSIEECFRLLVGHVGKNKDLLYSKSKELFGWDLMQFFYFYASNEAQRFLIFDAVREFRSPRKHKYIQEKVDSQIENIAQSNRQITLTEISEVLGIDRVLFMYHGIDHRIAAAREEQKQRLRAEKIKLLERDARIFIARKQGIEQPYTCDEVYKHIGSNRKWITKNCPSLGDWITNQLNMDKKRMIQIELDRLKQLCEAAVIELYQVGVTPNIREVAKHLLVPESKLYLTADIRQSIYDAIKRNENL